MLVLFVECWGSNLSIQDGVGKLNKDLHQPSGIRYESRSFSVRYLVSLAYWKLLISGFKLSVVALQAIGISLRNNGNQRKYIVIGIMVPPKSFFAFSSLPFPMWRCEFWKTLIQGMANNDNVVVTKKSFHFYRWHGWHESFKKVENHMSPCK